MPQFTDLNRVRIYTLIRILNSLNKPKIMRMIEIETLFRLNFISKVINSLEKGGFVTTERSGRVRYCTITTKGKVLLVQLQTLVSI